ncbi:MAG: adenine nucleotide alpha hydrolase [Candidatus Omnitrophica bacterium]|nr:adenine nucleotide alpha hydrolase [Candidatus Omnitrophota bacterium]
MSEIIFTSSGGKDSMFALYTLQQSGMYHIDRLLTTITEGYDRISMHGVRRQLIHQQARSLRIPLDIVEIPKDSSNEEYEQRMGKTLLRYKERGIGSVAFGDLFLEDVRAYRIKNLSKVSMDAIFPLWGQATSLLSRAFINAGFKAIVTCVDSHVLDRSFVGCDYDGKFLDELPDRVDPCGENGEFHSFVYDGPNFSYPVRFEKGRILLKNNRFWYCDLIETGRVMKKEGVEEDG